MLPSIESILGKEAEELLSYTSHVSKGDLNLPGPDWVDRIFRISDRNNRVLVNLQRLFNHGMLKGTGYLSILPVDQGVEHSAGASFSENVAYFDPENLVRLALEGGCNAIATTLGGLGIIARKYAHHIPFLLKLNHNELLSYPNSYDQILFASVKQASEMGCSAVGATIYFGSVESRRQIQEVSRAFAMAHECGMATVLWCYLRNEAFKTKDHDYHDAADLTGQANYLGATIEADIIKQKLPLCNGGFKALKFGKETEKMYALSSNHPIDMTRYQVMNGFMGRIGLINSGGASGKNDLFDAVRSAVINKRAGGIGLIAGRKVFQKSWEEGINMLQSIQNVYLSKHVTVA